MPTLDLPPGVDEARARLLLALGLFQEDDLSVGQAAEIAGLSYRAFVDTLIARGISPYTLTFDESDLAFLEAFRKERGLP
jgi:predicted HTH domain antitoxin